MMNESMQYKQNMDRAGLAIGCENQAKSRSPIEQRGEQLEKELHALNEAVSMLANRINKVLTPEVENPCTKDDTCTPMPSVSQLASAFDYAINSVRIQRMELARLAERVEL